MICIDCVRPDPLKRFINEFGNVATCACCGSDAICVEKVRLFFFIEERLKEILKPSSELSRYEQIMIYEGGTDDPHIMPIWEVIQERLVVGHENFECELIEWINPRWGLDEQGAELLFAIDDGSLEENSYEADWAKFVDGIHHGHRFFNDKARGFLEDIFGFLHKNGEIDKLLITKIDTNTEIFRARTSNSKEESDAILNSPWLQLGPAPKEKSTPQRMTPSGISAMYCSLERATCLSEIRAITSDIVISGAFTPLETLNLIDLCKLEELATPNLHPLSESYTKSCHASGFLKSLVYKISKPKGRQDDLAYLSTQAIFEYLRLNYSAQVDGIMFPSVQTGLKGKNIAIFPESSIIAPKEHNHEEWKKLNHENPFSEPTPKLIFKDGSFIFHKIKSIITESDDYSDRYLIDMDELTRSRLFPGTNQGM